MLSNNKFWFKVCNGNKGKKYYVLSKSFWNFIGNEVRKSEGFGHKSKIVREIVKSTEGKIDKIAISNWVYRFGKSDMRRPIIIPDSELCVKDKSVCFHGCRAFCPFCGMSKKINSPVPLLWRTDKSGKIYVFDEFWNDIINLLQNCEKYGLLPSNIYSKFDINDRVLRKWRNENIKPCLYSKKEFEFNPENLYWLGIHFSDGHLRNNGSKLSFTWQSGSSNPFQGYWFPQFIQNFMNVFKHKKNRSLTYIGGSKTNVWAFRTNISSFSPIFSNFLKKQNIIKIRGNSHTSSYSKYLPPNLIKYLEHKDALFQGIMDGDGSYYISDEHGINMYISLDPTVKCDFIDSFPLVPTIGLDKDKNRIIIKNSKPVFLREVRFAPSCLKSMSQKYSAEDIVNQIEFMLLSAENSIRPDKVHKLINIAKRMCSKKYGEYKSCLEIQKEIRNFMRKRNIIKLAKNLERRFPVQDGFYRPFTPKWAESFASKNVWMQEFWDFFLNGEYLVKKNYPKPESLDFSNGVPVNFDMTQIARN